MNEMLTVESIFSRGNNLLLRFSEEFGYVRAVTATVLSPDKDGIFLMIEQIEVFPNIKLGAEITLSYQTASGEEHIFGTYLIQKLIKESPILIVAQPKDVNFTSLRRFRRTDVNLPFEISVSGNKISGTVVNLSPCGLLASITSKQDLSVGQELTFELKFPTPPEPVQMSGHFVRSEIVGNNQTLAINFLNVTDEIREIIIDYTLYN